MIMVKPVLPLIHKQKIDFSSVQTNLFNDTIVKTQTTVGWN